MRPHSTLARLQRFTTIGLLLAAFAWLAWWWGAAPLLGLFGFVAILTGYAGFLGAEFILLRSVGRDKAAPVPTCVELARAWGGEVLDAPRVFCWRQPFRWNTEPDWLDATGRRGVVLVHGFVCNRGFWTPWLARLRRAGHPFIAVNLEPVFGSIDRYAPIIEDAVQRVTGATGLAPLIVCHSMGGLAARAWMRSHGGDGRVHHLVTIGSPHRGTWLGRFSQFANGRQMQLGSRWLQDMPPQPSGTPATCWYSNCDNIVFPVSSATLPGADNRLVRGVAHVHLAFQPQVLAHTLALLEQGEFRTTNRERNS
ncbi:alpha/beta fold hydrolase [Ramlibacter solisilvae]|uniref:Permease n=1 Tax=Ramlibacter tataouinensis TaxID=94132 RepID=A0A127JU47_9BURK|nr:alpha/beta fold hydrolase [Ramlibacter tataouinensis]AMO23507.1 permease [Ramlibacter tataouinensis]